MSSYRRPRRCGYCWNTGHDRRTCTQLTANARRRFDEATAAGGDPLLLNHYADILMGRTGIDPRTDKACSRPKRQRRCSYCKHKFGVRCSEGLDHTRRTCATLRSDKAADAAKNTKFRAGILDQLQHLGFAPGALVVMGVHGFFTDSGRFADNQHAPNVRWRYNEKALMVVGQIDWHRINFWSARAQVALCFPAPTPGRNAHKYALPQYSREGELCYWNADGTWGPWRAGSAHVGRARGQRVVGRVDAPLITPPDWLDGTGEALDRRFDKLRD